jgi:hypothetical protein
MFFIVTSVNSMLHWKESQWIQSNTELNLSEFNVDVTDEDYPWLQDIMHILTPLKRAQFSLRREELH